MANATGLYTREILALATRLSEWPPDPALPFQGKARSATCGSAITVDVATDREGRIERIGLGAQACAIGQASAAVFAAAAPGRDAADVAGAADSIRAWLKEGGALPDWPGLAAIAAARDYPSRHGAVLLAWEAALDALSSGSNAR